MPGALPLRFTLGFGSPACNNTYMSIYLIVHYYRFCMNLLNLLNIHEKPPIYRSIEIETKSPPCEGWDKGLVIKSKIILPHVEQLLFFSFKDTFKFLFH